ncbi:MAG: glycoside hydrolase family 2 TIM barrel-domain containing protein [Bacteroidota bacterium]
MKVYIRIGILVGILIGMGMSLLAQQHTRRLIEDWEYRKEEIGGIYEIWRPAKHDFSGWTQTDLPHCINALDAVDPDEKYYQGETWYRNRLKIDNPFPGGRTLLHFEGAGQKTKVFVYMDEVGSHVGGYDEFRVDLTESMESFKQNPLFQSKFEQSFPLAISCDNSRDLEMMPSDLSDFNLYGGIYRYLNLIYVPAISAEYLHINPEVSAEGSSARVRASIKLYNPDQLKEEVSLYLSIFSPEGKEIYQQELTTSTFDGDRQLFDFDLEEVKLWSPETPQLYTCKLSLSSKYGTQKLSEKFGLRYFEFKDKGPFYLNGERLLLRGTHRHEDHAGVAAAMTEDMIREEIQLMKEMGVNFIRLGHYQQSRIVLDVCDELGILVWEEIPWCRGGIGGAVYQEQGKRMLKNMISQHYNHPSVIIWGLGNENDWPGDFDTFDKEAIRTYMKELNSLSHQLDPGRKTAIRRCDFCKDIVDVYSPSIWAGWYRGKFTDYQKVSKMEADKVPHFLHVEWGASHHAGRHSENPDKGLEAITSKGSADEREGDFLMIGGESRASRDGDWTETYACNLIDWHLKEQEKMDWLSGTAYWPFKDFSTPLRPENPVPYVNQKGVVARDLKKKETYYIFQSYWTEKPMIRIYGHSWESRWGEPNERKVIKVYSNCPQVQLIVNGEKLSIKERNSQDFPGAGLRWAVKLKVGENRIQAIGHKDGQEVRDEIDFSYQIEQWGAPSQLKITKHAESEDKITLKAEIFDEHGVKCLDARNRVRFRIAGDGQLIENMGTSDASSVVQLYNGHAYISFWKKEGKSVVSVSSENISSAFFTQE